MALGLGFWMLSKVKRKAGMPELAMVFTFP